LWQSLETIEGAISETYQAAKNKKKKEDLNDSSKTEWQAWPAQLPCVHEKKTEKVVDDFKVLIKLVNEDAV